MRYTASMKRLRFATRATVLPLIALLVSACSSSTVIRSNVRGAKVYLNGALVGETPYVMRDTKIVGSVTDVRIEAHGYEPLQAFIKRNEDFQLGACIGGVFLLVPFIWVMGYYPDHMYELRPLGQGPRDQYQPPPGQRGQPYRAPINQPPPGPPPNYRP